MMCGMAALSPDEGNAILDDYFAPWVRDLGLVVEKTSTDHAIIRRPWNDRLARDGGAISGQPLRGVSAPCEVCKQRLGGNRERNVIILSWRGGGAD